MKNKKVVLIILLIVGILFLGAALYNVFLVKKSNVSILNESWNLNIPIPSKEIDVFDTQDGINGDGQNYLIYEFSEESFKQIINLHDGIVVDKNNINEIEKNINKFKEDSISININNKSKVEEGLTKYKLQPEEGDRYIYKKNYENYIILLIKKDEQKIYSLAWNQ